MKACSRCGESKDDAEFSRDSSKRSGLRSQCRDCTSASRAVSRAAVRAAAIAVYGGECVKCHTTEDSEFDHIDWNGWKHRREESPAAMVRRIARSGLPHPEYRLRVLCRRCHRSPGARERLAPPSWLPLFPWEDLLEGDPDGSGGAVVGELASNDHAADGAFGDAEG